MKLRLRKYSYFLGTFIFGCSIVNASASKATVQVFAKSKPVINQTHLTSTTDVKLAQVGTLTDVQNSWARSFIEALFAQQIIQGFPDGTFRPDAPVTRAEFAAMISKAFPNPAVRPGINFNDVPNSFWGYNAIQAAYQSGFLQGFPNGDFLPGQNIPRVQALVSLATGLQLNPSNTNVLSASYTDAADIPSYAVNQIAAATENRFVVNYPNVALLNPNQVATRGEIAAFIYQALVKAGKVPALPAADVASRYIAGAATASTPTTQTPEQIAALRKQRLLPLAAVAKIEPRTLGGSSSIGTPTAFGADRFQAYIGGSYQNRTRFSNKDDGGIAFGIGLGDARKLIGLEVTFASYSTFREGFFTNSGLSFKAHRLITNDLAIAVGVDNLVTFGSPDGGSDVYGVVSKVFPFKKGDYRRSVTASIGVGGGRFRSLSDINRRGDDSVNVFGSVGVRVAEPLSLIGEWTGQNLNLGASIQPFHNIPLIITPAVADITDNAGDGARFVLGVGYGFKF